jgi:poly-D-alanine transfer protein DltD
MSDSNSTTEQNNLTSEKIIELQLNRIQDKLQQLLKQQAVLQKENLSLNDELEKIKKQTSIHQQTADTLKQQVEVMKITAGSWNDTDKKDFEKRITGYIKEIDKCIAVMKK